MAGHGDNPIGFRYHVDRKGRIYPNGEFHHQTSSAVKKLFTTEDGRALGDMVSIDHTGSGWQIAAYMSKDDMIAHAVNIAGGQRSKGIKATKGDIYVMIGDAIYRRVKGGIDG